MNRNYEMVSNYSGNGIEYSILNDKLTKNVSFTHRYAHISKQRATEGF